MSPLKIILEDKPNFEKPHFFYVGYKAKDWASEQKLSDQL